MKRNLVYSMRAEKGRQSIALFDFSWKFVGQLQFLPLFTHPQMLMKALCVLILGLPAIASGWIHKYGTREWWELTVYENETGKENTYVAFVMNVCTTAALNVLWQPKMNFKLSFRDISPWNYQWVINRRVLLFWYGMERCVFIPHHSDAEFDHRLPWF